MSVHLRARPIMSSCCTMYHTGFLASSPGFPASAFPQWVATVTSFPDLNEASKLWIHHKCRRRSQYMMHQWACVCCVCVTDYTLSNFSGVTVISYPPRVWYPLGTKSPVIQYPKYQNTGDLVPPDMKSPSEDQGLRWSDTIGVMVPRRFQAKLR